MLKSWAQKSLEANVEFVEDQPYLTAGRNHFRTLWTRDFCFSVKGLLLIQRTDVVKSHLNLLLKNMRADGLIPRVLDSFSTRWRVSLSCLSHVASLFPKSLPLKRPLKPEYYDEHGSSALDSNVLFLLACKDFESHSAEGKRWFDRHYDKINKTLSYVMGQMNSNGLLEQTDFSDWQDSVKRPGLGSYVNLLLYFVLRDYGLPTKNTRGALIQNLWCQEAGLWKSLSDLPYYSLDSQLLALNRDFWEPKLAETHYQNLLKSEFYIRNKIPGFVTFPNYPKKWHSLAVQLSGLSHYHDELYWTWLMALAGKVAKRFQDEKTFNDIYNSFLQLAQSQEFVPEILDQKKFQPWHSWLYVSEAPFSWGAAQIIEFCELTPPQR